MAKAKAKSSAKVTQEFVKELKELLTKYNSKEQVAEFDFFQEHVDVYIPALYDEDGRYIRESTLIDIKKFFMEI